MSDWLYPLSGSSGRWFVDSSGNEYDDTSFESFVDMMRSPSTDDWWYLATNFRKVAVHDRIWCYYGRADGDRGVVALATVQSVRHDEEAGTHDIHLNWKRTPTRRLLRSPVPASRVRRFIPTPRAAVQAIDPYPALVAELEQAAGI